MNVLIFEITLSRESPNSFIYRLFDSHMSVSSDFLLPILNFYSIVL